MIKLTMPQGSKEWIDARLGIPTASAFGKLITPKTQKPSASQDAYMNQLLAEWLIGESLDEAVSAFMERGHQMEVDAVRFYEGLKDVDTEEVGFCLSDDRRIGCSPDRLVGENGGLEIKCFAAANHVAALRSLGDSPKNNKYYPQIQGALWITGREWWDFAAYHPTIQPVIVRYERDTDFIAKLAEIADGFCDKMEVERAALVAAGCEPVKR